MSYVSYRGNMKYSPETGFYHKWLLMYHSWLAKMPFVAFVANENIYRKTINHVTDLISVKNHVFSNLWNILHDKQYTMMENDELP